MTNYENVQVSVENHSTKNQEDIKLNVKRQSRDTNIKMTGDVRIIWFETTHDKNASPSNYDYTWNKEAVLRNNKNNY